MARPRPRVDGKPSPSVSERGDKSRAPSMARVVPLPLAQNALEAKRKLEGSFRSKAAKRLMGTTGEMYRKTDADAGGEGY